MVSERVFPLTSKLCGKEINPYYRDSFQVEVSKTDLEAKNVYHSIFGFLPRPVQLALSFRNALVRYLGFSVTNTEISLPLEDIQNGQNTGYLTIESVASSEVICAAYEANMDMWLSVLKLSEQQFAISTLVNLKTKKGKAYMAFIKPFHKLVLKYCIKQALKVGRI